MTVLVVAAHPDDEVLGCGASIAKWTCEGTEVHVLILAEGATSREASRDLKTTAKQVSCLAESAHRAGEILGIASITLLGLPDNRMDTVDRIDVIKAIEEKVRQIRPSTVATHHAGDLNIDHRIAHESVVVACRPQPGHPVKNILAYEVPSSTEWQSPGSAPTFQPNTFEDVTGTLHLKLLALEEYGSEMRPWPHPRSVQSVEHLARWRGATIGCEAAEAYMLMRAIR